MRNHHCVILNTRCVLQREMENEYSKMFAQIQMMQRLRLQLQSLVLRQPLLHTCQYAGVAEQGVVHDRFLYSLIFSRKLNVVSSHGTVLCNLDNFERKR